MLKTRIVTALFLVAGLLAALAWLPAAGLYLLLALVLGLAGWEWAGLLRRPSAQRVLYGGLTAALCWPLSLLLSASERALAPAPLLQGLWWLAALWWCLFVPLWLRHQWRLQNLLVGWLIGWLLLLPSAAALAWLYLRSPKELLAILAIAWVADIAAYFSGRAWGTHKLAPSVSPGKTWEGAAGAVLGVILYGLLVLAWSGRVELGFKEAAPLPGLAGLVAVLVLLTAVSILGDLFESLIKRQAGVKDSSGLLPGHGGILDRIDSLTSTLPLAALAVHHLAVLNP